MTIPFMETDNIIQCLEYDDIRCHTVPFLRSWPVKTLILYCSLWWWGFRVIKMPYVYPKAYSSGVEKLDGRDLRVSVSSFFLNKGH